MSAMGLGAFVSKYLHRQLFDWFVGSEILVGLVGGSSALLLFWTYAVTDYYEYAFVAVTVLIGVLVGLEIPLLIRILEDQETLRQNVAHVLSYDYLGGLIGALIFPVVLLPFLGLMRTALVLGLMNLAVALVNFVRHRQLLQRFSLLAMAALGVGGWLGYACWQAPQLQQLLEQNLYRDKVIFSKQTPYQHLTITAWHKDLRLFINGGLQFSSLDEYRYHESLVHAPMSLLPDAKAVLILGGGDGLAVRELLKYPFLKNITLVDIDPAMTDLFQHEPQLVALNHNSLNSHKVTIHHQDAYKFAEQDNHFYDLILVDLPDPSNTALAKLYSRGFYEILKKRLSQRGVLVTQSTSPFFAPEAFWCINKTLRATGMQVYPYQLDVPSFGNWGFQLASRRVLNPEQFNVSRSLTSLRFLTTPTLRSLFVMPLDLSMDLNKIQINTIMQPVILSYYQRGWNGIR